MLLLIISYLADSVYLFLDVRKYFIFSTSTLIALPVILNSTPVGPSFPAATWITFDCSTSGDSGSGVYTYVWNVYCSSSMELVYQSSAGSATSLQIKSTPTECFDVIECVISDTILPASNRSSVTISDVTGESVC